MPTYVIQSENGTRSEILLQKQRVCARSVLPINLDQADDPRLLKKAVRELRLGIIENAAKLIDREGLMTYRLHRSLVSDQAEIVAWGIFSKRSEDDIKRNRLEVL